MMNSAENIECYMKEEEEGKDEVDQRSFSLDELSYLVGALV